MQSLFLQERMLRSHRGWPVPIDRGGSYHGVTAELLIRPSAEKQRVLTGIPALGDGGCPCRGLRRPVGSDQGRVRGDLHVHRGPDLTRLRAHSHFCHRGRQADSLIA